MKIAIAMVRDEEDIIMYTLSQMMKYADAAIIADNGSKDRTRDILETFRDQNVTVIDDPDVGYHQDVKMTRLAQMAGDMGADWILPFDADEAWVYPEHVFEDSDVVVLKMRSKVFVPDVSDDPQEFNPLVRIVHHIGQEPLPKVAFRWTPAARLHMGNHGVDHVETNLRGRSQIIYGMRHYQYRSLEQAKRKVRQGTAAYDATKLPHMYGSHWRQLASLTDGQMAQWWESYINQPKIKTTSLI